MNDIEKSIAQLEALKAELERHGADLAEREAKLKQAEAELEALRHQHTRERQIDFQFIRWAMTHCPNCAELSDNEFEVLFDRFLKRQKE